MDWDRVDKSDVLGKIELNTQHRQQRLLSNQQLTMQEQKTRRKSFFNSPNVAMCNYPPLRDEMETCIDDETDYKKSMQLNWFDIFYKPDQHILLNLQIDNF